MSRTDFFKAGGRWGLVLGFGALVKASGISVLTSVSTAYPQSWG
jgi:hypothetical protein